MMKIKKKYIIISLIILIPALFIINYMLFSAVEVEAESVKKGNIVSYIEETAKTQLKDKITVYMPFNGKLEYINVKEGDKVRAGQVIAVISDFEIRQQIRQLTEKINAINAQLKGVDSRKPVNETINSNVLSQKKVNQALKKLMLDLDTAKRKFKIAAKDHKRAKTQYTAGVISQKEYEQYKDNWETSLEDVKKYEKSVEINKTDLKISKNEYDSILKSLKDNEYQKTGYGSDIKSIYSQISVLQDSLSKTRVISPVNGVILEKFVSNFAFLPYGTSIVSIGQKGNLNKIPDLEIRADILTDDVTGIKTGSRVIIEGDCLHNKKLNGKVVKIYPSAFTKISTLGVEQQRVAVIIDFLQPFDGIIDSLGSGYSIDVKIVTNEKNQVLLLPENAVFEKNNAQCSLIVQDSKVKMKKLKIGLKDKENYEVLEGLKEGDSVIVNPSNELQENMKVKIKKNVK